MQVRPRAALNAQLLRLNEGYRSAGIARYIYHLLRELPAAADDIDLNVYATEPLAPKLLSNVIIHPTRLPVHKPLARIFWEQTVFAWQLFSEHYSLLHSLAYVSPFLNRTPGIVTLYDLSFYLYPNYFPTLQRLYLQWGTRLSVRRAHRIIAISESTKRDAMRIFNLNPERIDVVTPGVEPEFFDAIDTGTLEQFRREKHLPEKFVLFIGTREPRKNIPTLLSAFAQARREANLPHRLVIAGGRGWMGENIPRALDELGMTQDVIFPGFVPHDELRLWYHAADAFVYPSQYEGFGMPPLEALASGTPVITSNVSALPEAVGSAAVLVDPHDPSSFADALVRVLTDDTLREDLKQRGARHARQFTWTRAAQLTAASYRRALGITTSEMSLRAPVAKQTSTNPIQEWSS